MKHSRAGRTAAEPRDVQAVGPLHFVLEAREDCVLLTRSDGLEARFGPGIAPQHEGLWRTLLETDAQSEVTSGTSRRVLSILCLMASRPHREGDIGGVSVKELDGLPGWEAEKGSGERAAEVKRLLAGKFVGMEPGTPGHRPTPARIVFTRATIELKAPPGPGDTARAWLARNDPWSQGASVARQDISDGRWAYSLWNNSEERFLCGTFHCSGEELTEGRVVIVDESGVPLLAEASWRGVATQFDEVAVITFSVETFETGNYSVGKYVGVMALRRLPDGTLAGDTRDFAGNACKAYAWPIKVADEENALKRSIADAAERGARERLRREARASVGT